MERVEFLDIKGIMECTGVGRVLAERYAKECGLALPRLKGGPWKIPKEAFIRWLEERK